MWAWVACVGDVLGVDFSTGAWCSNFLCLSWVCLFVVGVSGGGQSLSNGVALGHGGVEID